MVDLCDMAPELEEKLRCISFTLEQGSLHNVPTILPNTPQQVILMEMEASHCHHLSEEWMAMLDEV